jgi:hypothetical protein
LPTRVGDFGGSAHGDCGACWCEVFGSEATIIAESGFLDDAIDTEIIG